jgi:hypothetical protein
VSKIHVSCLYVLVRISKPDRPVTVVLDGRKHVPAFQRLTDAMVFAGRVCPDDVTVYLTDDVGSLGAFVEASQGDVRGIAIDPSYDESEGVWSYGFVEKLSPRAEDRCAAAAETR